jgi:hypothetical protein
MWTGGGGARAPPRPLDRIVADAVRILPSAESLPRTTSAWLQTHVHLEHIEHILHAEDLGDLLTQLQTNRVAFLARLKALGVSKLNDRQAVANSLGRDRREGAIWLPGEPPPAQPSAQQPPQSANESPPAAPATTPVAPSALPSSLTDTTFEAAECAVMGLIHAGRPSSAVQKARTLGKSSSARLLLGHALASAGSLASAALAYKEAAEAADCTSEIAAEAADGARKLFELVRVVDKLGTSVPLFFPRRVECPPDPHDLSAWSGTYETPFASSSPHHGGGGGDHNGDGGGGHGRLEIGYRVWRVPSVRGGGRGRGGAARGGRG